MGSSSAIGLAMGFLKVSTRFALTNFSVRARKSTGLTEYASPALFCLPRKCQYGIISDITKHHSRAQPSQSFSWPAGGWNQGEVKGRRLMGGSRQGSRAGLVKPSSIQPQTV